MTLHLIKLSVGTEDLKGLGRWQAQRRKKYGRVFHRTRMMPKRAEEILDGGSIYWVIKGVVRARQQMIGIERVADEAGRPATLLVHHSKLVRTWPQVWRAFQGWRYLVPEDAPLDLDVALAGAGGDVGEMPSEMLVELRELGLL